MFFIRHTSLLAGRLLLASHSCSIFIYSTNITRCPLRKKMSDKINGVGVALLTKSFGVFLMGGWHVRVAMIALASASSLLGGCGLSVPEIQENAFAPGHAVLMVQAIVQSVHCEMANALKDVRKYDLETAKKFHQKPNTDFLLRWGAELTLTLKIDEKSSLNPNVTWMPPSPASAIFTLGAGLSGAADATRTDKMSFYYLVPTLLNEPYCATGVQQGEDSSLLVRSDLKLKEWLQDYLSAIGTKEGKPPVTADGALKDTVLSHDIKFDIATSGGITPSWKLTSASVNPIGSFFSTSRERNHDLTITMGPGDKTGFIGRAAPAASSAIQIGNAVAASLQSVVAKPIIPSPF